jgi:hypothetical protein
LPVQDVLPIVFLRYYACLMMHMVDQI